MSKDKIVPKLESLVALRNGYSLLHMSVVWTNGCFDLLHIGHVRSLKEARGLGDVLVVGVNSDDSVRRLKGPGRPIMPEADRAEVLASLACVDHVLIFDDDTPCEVLAWLKPEIHCKGGDYAPPSERPIPEAGVVRAYGGRVVFLKYTPGVSTTRILTRLEEPR